MNEDDKLLFMAIALTVIFSFLLSLLYAMST